MTLADQLKTCSIEDCDRKLRARGLCVSHYNSARLAGEFETTPRTPTRYNCSFEGCEKKHLANGLCAAHHSQRRAGTELRPARTLGMPVHDRFNLYVDKSGDCWEWTGYKNKKGYGIFNPTTSVAAHRVSFELANGPIPEGAEVDHRCLNRGCVNPTHLRLTTRKQNMENRAGASAASKTGIRGVSYLPERNKWIAYVGHNGKLNHLGSFDTPEEADAAATAKRLELFTHNEIDRMKAKESA